MSNDGVIARGRIKVDARKALDKLRDHMLVDPHLWACEIARVAVALGATQLDVDWDSDELRFDFDGRSLAPDQVAHARDHVLTPLDGPDGDALRALGIAIGAALSLDPAYIEVYASGHRIRFDRKYVEDAAAAPTPTVVPNEGGRTTRVLFKRKLGFGLLARIAETPEEIPLLKQDFDAPSCTLRLRGASSAQPPREPPVLTVDLDVPGTTRAHLEVLRRPYEPRIDFLHYGVRIESSNVRGLWGLGSRVEARLPIRIVVDATDLPTNASRSQVRNDATLIQTVFGRVDAAFAVAVAALCGESTANAAKIGHLVTAHAEVAVLTDVLGAIAAEVAVATRAGQVVDDAAKRLLDEPVCFDALGRRVSLASLRGGTQAEPLRVYEDTKALPESLAPWLIGTLWKRGLSAERAVEGLFTASVQDLVEPALAAMQRRARAMEHPYSKPVTAGTRTEWKETFHVALGPFSGLEGEVALGGGQKLATVRVFVDGRLLETITVPGARFPVEIALSWPDHLVATFAYDAVERNDDLTRALHYALRVAAMGVARHTKDPALVRLATRAWADATRSLGDGTIAPAGLGTLATTPAWRTNDGKLVSFATIYAFAKMTHALCYAQVKQPSPDGRLVVDPADIPALRGILGDDIDYVAYDRALTANHEASEAVPSLAVMVHRGRIDGFIAPSAEKRSQLRVYHAGVCYRRQVWQAKNGAVDVVLVDRAAIPSADGTGFRFASPLPDLGAEEDALVEVVTQACESESVELAVVERYLETSRAMILDRKSNQALAKRIHELPQRREKQRLERLKAAVRARLAFDVESVTAGRPRGTAVFSGKGAVTCVLGRGAPATLLFEGHHIGSVLIGHLDVEAVIDVVDESFVKDWQYLTEEGVSWAEEAVRDAALDLLDKLSTFDGFTESELALKLAIALSPEAPMRIGALVGRLPWPTVQGATIALGDVTRSNAGVHRFGPWRTGEDASPYDAPALHLPATKIGELRRKLFAAASIQLTDVTEATTRLQALRAKTGGEAAPKLEGAPTHPLLRRSLAQLGATFIEGEIELIDAHACDISRVRANGVREMVSIETGCPARVVFRSEVDDNLGAGRELVEVTKKLLREVTKHLDKLPPFVTKRVRALALANLAQSGRMEDADRNLPIFEATNGRVYRLSFLQSFASYTTDPPPYPPINDIVLCLDPNEASALSKVFELRDDTHAMRARARGLAARSAPPLTEIRVQEREQCLFFISVDEEGVKGEIGLLKPSHHASRRIDVYTTMRPLTFLPDPEGWPIIAALNDDNLQIDDGFSALLDPKRDTTRFHQLVRRILGSSISKLLAAPSDNIGVVRLPVPLLLRSVRSKRTGAAMGVFWLTREWPERPTIEVEGIGVVDLERPPLMDGLGSSRLVPVSGKLWVTAEAGDLARAIEDVMAWVSVRLTPYVRSPARANNVATARYTWDLALLGVLEDDAKDPARELATDRPNAELMHVVARRAPHLIDRQTGDKPTAPIHVQHAQIDANPVERAAPTDVAIADADVDRASAPSEEGFLAGLVRRVKELVTGAPQLLEETPLTAALSQSVGGLQLTGNPVLYVQAAKKGRPIAYDRDTRKLIVNAAHPTVKALASSENGILYLVLAALSEINRELVSVTDAEEVAKLLEMLRANQV